MSGGSAPEPQQVVPSRPKPEPEPHVVNQNPEPEPQVVKSNVQTAQGILKGLAAQIDAKIDPGFASTTAIGVAGGAAEKPVTQIAEKQRGKMHIDFFSDDEEGAGNKTAKRA